MPPGWDWRRCAVVARERSYLHPVRAPCEIEGIPVQLDNEEFTGVWRLRETQALVDWLRRRDSRVVSSFEVDEWLARQRPGPWVELLQEGISGYALETGGAETPTDNFIEWLAEWAREARRRQRGLMLLTAHRAKGLEFDHMVVLDGRWNRLGPGEDADEQRRLYYVAITRARQTLTLMQMEFARPHRFNDALLNDSPDVIRREPAALPPAAPELARRYVRLSLRDVFLGFAGRRHTDHPVHRAIAALSPGDLLQARAGPQRWELLDGDGVVVGQLSRDFEPPAGMRCAAATVLAVARWDRDHSDAQYRNGYLCDAWEVVVPELVFEPT